MSYSEAVLEAFATASSDEVIFDTLELIHPNFRGDNGEQITVRIVLGNDNIQAKLEASAPFNPNQVVTFLACDFSIKLPDVSTSVVPQLQISIANTDRTMSKHIEEAAEVYDAIQVIYRPYLLSSLLNGPEADPPYLLEMADITVDVFQISGTATLDNVYNWPFPAKTYKPSVFRGLAR